jgi:hypothetical protein
MPVLIIVYSFLKNTSIVSGVLDIELVQPEDFQIHGPLLRFEYALLRYVQPISEILKS